MYRFRGKNWSEEDLERIRNIIASNPSALRIHLAKIVCETFDWRRPDGRLKDMACRVAMLEMHRANLITLPEPSIKMTPSSKVFSSTASDPQPILSVDVSELDELHLQVVNRSTPKESRLWNEYISRYHYLGYKITPGANIRYLIKSGDQILGAMGFGGAAWKIAPRDAYIGWDHNQRVEGLPLIVNQVRFLILPWVQCKNLATKSLAMARRQVPQDWQKFYGYQPVLLETFVDDSKYKGTCYKAGNWIKVGLTTGRSRQDRYNKLRVPTKSIWLLPLHRNFRNRLLASQGGGHG